jgi:hypothetical protein
LRGAGAEVVDVFFPIREMARQASIFVIPAHGLYAGSMQLRHSRAGGNPVGHAVFSKTLSPADSRFPGNDM